MQAPGYARKIRGLAREAERSSFKFAERSGNRGIGSFSESTKRQQDPKFPRRTRGRRRIEGEPGSGTRHGAGCEGNPIPNLKREDFQVFDQGKLQPITVFAVETRESRREKALAAAKTQADASGSGESKTVLPDRFVAMEFDDIHLATESATYTRKSAEQFLANLAPTDRVGIFTTSGEVTQEFTSDVALLKQKLLGVVPRPKVGHTSTNDCPDVSPYVADLVQNRNDQMALRTAVVKDAWQCAL